MPYAVTLRLDDRAAARIAAIQQIHAHQTGDRRICDLGYPPHLTLAVLPDETPMDGIRDAMFDVVDGFAALPITLTGLGVFPGRSPIVWAVPAASLPLVSLHTKLIAALSQFDVYSHYRVGAWVPHVTLGHQSQTMTPHAMGTAVAAWKEPIEGRLERAELVRFTPVTVLLSLQLAVP